ncbi:MAG: hypothetical protein QG641_2437 [Candidatus Poribacteria bacterium]|nr:hypothetical protein [Candidatus Poribacteria bacterium]MDQ1329148.1 hypothetical protein [Candidatus Poribacteria bacterium]
MILTVLLIILIIAVIGSLPVFPHSREWGYFPGGILGIIVLILVILYLTGHRF